MSLLRRQLVVPSGRARLARPHRVAVIGGGIAGVAAATVLSERGARVTLFEKERFLGGRAGAWEDQLETGERFSMERGFHAFFRQYYNLRSLLRRVDPALSFLAPVDDYPILGAMGRVESFKALPSLPILNVAAVTLRSPSLSLRDLRQVDARSAAKMLSYAGERTYTEMDACSAGAYLDSLRFPAKARQMLFDVFAHSFFNPEEEMSAAELLMMFHFYFCGNPDGLLFDVSRDPFSTTIFGPLGERLQRHGVELRVGTAVAQVLREEERFVVVPTEGVGERYEAVVLALSVPGLLAILEDSPGLGDEGWRARVRSLEVTRPFAVWRLWLDRPVDASRVAFAGTTGVGLLDNISVYERIEEESRAWATKTRGSVIELHAYAVPEGLDEQAIKKDLLSGLYALYAETRGARIVEERWLWRQDCPAFKPGSHAMRPTVTTSDPGLMLAGDFVKLPFPSALMERAAASGFMAANALLERWHVRGEPMRSIAPRGVFASLPF